MGWKNCMKPLSVFTYYRSNKRKVIPVILIIALSILGITAAAAFTGAINKDIEIEAKFYDHYSVVQVNSESTVTIDQLLANANIIDNAQAVFIGSRRGISTPSIIGSGAAFVYMLAVDDQEKFIKPLGWTLQEGRLPLTSNEIVLTQTLLTVKHLHVGDYIGQDIAADELLPGKYLIVGALQTAEPYYAAITSNAASTEIDTMVIQPKIGNEDKLETVLSNLEESDHVDAYTATQMHADLATEFAMLDTILWAINSVTIIVITLSIGLINIIFFMQRANEFGLLAALGYSQVSIIRKTVLESLGMVAIGWLLGIVFTQVVYTVLNTTLFADTAFGLTILDTRMILFSLPVPVSVMLFSVITVVWKLWRLDPIAIIEKRD